MIEEADDPKEVSTFHFCQLRTLKLVKQNENVPEKAVNLVAAASKYGLLFVGIKNGFKILKLENILDLDEEKENKNLEENYFSQFVACKTPVMLSLSSDQKTLAVCVSNNSSMVADMYDIAAFADPEETPAPFLNVQLSVNQTELKNFLWNPAIDGMYAYCLSDGSLHVHELSGTVLKIIADQPQAAATALCWSPKGKQLVVGKKDGSFSQYKPTLQEVKNIPSPQLDEGPVYVASICWMSTMLFAVLYVPTGDNVSPSLVLVSTPKGSPIVYTNFYDVCLGNASSNDQRYFLHYESAWEILVCGSTDSIEIAVIGDAPKWIQWDVKEDGKALLPGKDGATHAIGMDVMYCAQRRIVISEHESYLPMPVIFFLTNNGLLVPFHMINSATDAVSLVRPSTPIERDNERKADVNENVSLVSSEVVTESSVVRNMPNIVPPLSAAPVYPPSSQTMHSNNVETSVIKESPFKAWSNNITANPLASVVTTGRESSIFGYEPQQFSPSCAPQNSQIPKSTPNHSFYGGQSLAPNSTAIPSEIEKVHKLSKGMPLNINMPILQKDFGTNVRQLAVAQRSIPVSKPAENESQIRVPSLQQSAQPPVYQNDPSKTIIRNEVKLSNQNTYMVAIAEEINNFEKELQDLKQSANHVISIGSKEEMSNLNVSTLSLQDFQKDMSETMQSLNGDIHSLKNVLLENFVMVEEAYSRERRKNDHSYISMLKDRALDPVTAKRMQKINQHYHYLLTQMQEVNDKLDQDWIEYIEAKKKSKRAVHYISSAEAIYKTIVNNQKIIHNLRNSVESVSKKVMERKLANISKRKNWTHYSKRTEQDDLSKLADAFLQAKFINADNDESHSKSTRKISPKAQNVLKKLLTNSNITTVRPTVIYSPSQSRLISKSLLYPESRKEPAQHSMGPDESKVTSDNNIPFLEHNRFHMSDCVLPNSIKVVNEPPKEVNNTSASKYSVPSHRFSIAHIISPTTSGHPVYENITPPDSPFHTANSFHHDGDVVTVSFSGDGYGLAQMPTSSALESSNGISHSLVAADTINQQSGQSHSPSSRVSINQLQNFSVHTFQDKPFATNAQTSSVSSSSQIKPSFLPVSSDNVSKAFVPKNIIDASKENAVSQKSNSVFQALNTTVSSSVSNPKTITSLGTEAHTETNASVSTKPALSFSLGPHFIFKQPSSASSGAVTKSLSSVSNSNSKNSELASKEVSGASSKSFLPSPFFSAQVKESSKPEVSANQATTTPFGSSNKPEVSANQATTTLFGSGNKTSAFALSKSSSETSFLNQKDGTSGEMGFLKPSVPTLDFAKSSNKIENEKATSVSRVIQKSPKESITGSVSSNSIVETSSASESKNNTASIKLSGDFKSQTVTAVPSSAAQTIAEHEANSVARSVSENLVQGESNAILQETNDAKAVLDPNVVTSLAAVTSSEQTSTISIASVFSLTTASSPTTTMTSTTLFSNVNSTNSSSLFAHPTSTAPSLFSNTVSSDSSKTPSSQNDTSVSQNDTSNSSQVIPSTQPATSSLGQTSAPLPDFAQTVNVTNVTTTFSTPVSTTATSVFGQNSNQTSSFFGQAATTQSSFFSKGTSDVPSFGQVSVTQNSPFGQPLNSTPFAQGAATFFSQPSGGQAPVFGGTADVSNSVIESQPTSGFSFGKSAFGQTAGSFGLAKSVFGQNASTFQPPASTSSSSFGQTSGGSVFGQSSFFSGLGEKPNPENASKNVFGVANLGKSSTDNNIFGGAGSTTFGSKSGSSFSGGSFSSGDGSVVQSGFGAFQQSSQKSGGFGSPPAFGSAPAFGSSPAFGSAPAFGSSPAFGSGSPIGSSVFGGGQQNANFSSFASANSVTFGSLASQSSGFGSPQQQQPTFGQQSSPFGAAPVFGSSPPFGGQPSSFGSPSSPQGTSAFTQWRN